MVELRERERTVLLTLHKLGGRASEEQIVMESHLPHSSVTRSLLALQENAFVQTESKTESYARLTDEGNSHAKKGLPERRLIIAIKKIGGKASIGEAAKVAGLEGQFIPIALGWVQEKKWAVLDPKTKSLLSEARVEESSEEKLLELLNEANVPVVISTLSSELQDAAKILKSRKLLEVEERTSRIAHLTEKGEKKIRKGLKTAVEVTQLTPELVVSGKWRKVRLQEYNLRAAVTNVWPGKKHPYHNFVDEVKQKLVDLGFQEMTGTAVETSFFNFDALYMPQDHPAREIFGIYNVKSPRYGNLDSYKRALQDVKETHENGWKTGSSGWQYKYSFKEARRLILRGHGTCLSARTLVSKGLEIPGKYFSIARCYRPEVLDKTHLTEFNQVEGIIIDENLTIRDLLGVLGKFALEIAEADQVRFRPDYFPFTEPSVELNAYRKGFGWAEFGGSGIFRPEVTLPLGIKIPVIAWGLGIDRLFMMKAKVGDIRQIFSTNLDWIRRKELV